ncbi:DUF4430 domain-containing protein [Paenibacillus sinopodophylli]|uniref:DUF4430 domain-containing protein n=1 Tax=Paenibacillus sinopodophylli TaxID=1837342 RepID=UPI00110CC0DF|nr:DUF4430 domain-containing protein [Paenibacillus sinopodophylli]
MRKQHFSRKWLALVLSLTLFISAASSAFLPSQAAAASDANPKLGPFTIYHALPAPGQFANTTGFGGINDLNLTWDNTSLSDGISLGGFGGSIIIKTDSSVLNDNNHPYGVDFTLYGNAFNNSEEPGGIAVAQDDGTGKPGKWYNIAGSEHYEDSTIWDYTVTYTNPDPEFTVANGVNIPWVDNYGGTGEIKTNIYNKHAYYPIPANYPLSITPLNNVTHTYSGVKITKRKTAFGYTDVHSNGSAPYNIAGNPYIAAPAKGEGIDISWAVDEDGLPANLDSVDFIKVHTAVQIDGGALGEVSPEVTSLQMHESDNTVGQTPSLSSITLTGVKSGSGSKTVSIQDSVYVYQDIQVDADSIKITANADQTIDQIFVNDTRGAANTQINKEITLSAKEPRLVRVIAQTGTSEPKIYYLSILKSTDKVDVAVEKTTNYIKSQGVASEWQAVGMAQARKKVPALYYNQLVTDLKNANGTFTRVTDYARYAIAISALGYDATSFEGYNFIEKIYNNARMTNQGVNGPVYSLIALDSLAYQVPADAEWTRDKLLENILQSQKSDGGFSLSGSSDADLTAMTLIALAPYKDQATVKTAGEKAVAWLTLNQQPHGGYGGESSESVSQAIIGLSAFGIDPTSAAYTKNGINLLDKLFSFAQTDGGFAHLLPGTSNGLATEQALQALVAYRLFVDDQKLYQFAGKTMPGVQFPSDITINIEGPQALIAEGHTKGAFALDALELFADENNVTLQIADSSYGKYLKTVEGISEATYGGYDGWQYAVKRGGEWIYPAIGIAEFELLPADHLLVYYGDFNTQYVNTVVVSPSEPRVGQDFTIQVNKETLDWNTNQVVKTPVAGASVAFGNKTATTNADGEAVFYGGLTSVGIQSGVVTKYVADGAPSIVRHKFNVTIAPADPTAVDTFVTLKVVGDDEKGMIVNSKTYKRFEHDTAFSILKRELGDKVLSSGTGASVYVSSIDGLAAFDRGDNSGWLVAVNGVLLDVGAGAYTLQPNDVVTWIYTLDYTKEIEIDTGVTDVSLAIEGPQGVISEGSIQGVTALDALQRFTENEGKQFAVKSFSFGLALDSIDYISSGIYGGYDGWNYAINRDGQWIYPPVGAGEFELQSTDHVLVYYGDFNTQLVSEVAVSSADPKVGKDLSVLVTKETWDWTNNEAIITPAVGAKIAFGSKTAITNTDGEAVFYGGLATAGTQIGVITQYTTDGAPSVVRQAFELTVLPADPNEISRFVTLKVVGDDEKGTILSSKTYKIQENETAFSILKRELGDKVISIGTGSALSVSAIDGLSELDLGPLSGWNYFVNGVIGNYSAAEYKLEPNDVVIWKYAKNKEEASSVGNGLVDAVITVEGPQGLVSEGSIQGVTALDALQRFTGSTGKQFGVKSYSFGLAIDSIDHIANGIYGGYDGWNFAIKRDGQWIIPPVGAGEFELQSTDHVLVYYGDFNTQLVSEVVVSPANPIVGQDFSVLVTKETWDWTANEAIITPVVGAKVAFGSKSAITNATGKAVFNDGLATTGTQSGVITQYNTDEAPSVVRQSFSIMVQSAPVTPTQSVTISVKGDSQKGTIVPSKSVQLQPGDTPFSVLKRELGASVKSRGTGSTLYVEEIDGLAEFDRGPLSGWLYSVNGVFPNYSAGSYTLQPNDVVAWSYTTDGVSTPPSGGNTGTTLPAVSGAVPQDVSNELDKIALPANNTNPIGKTGQATNTINASTPMTATEIAELIKLLNKSIIKLSQSGAPNSETVIQDADSKVKLVVPAGALKNQTTINIEQLSIKRSELVSAVFEFTNGGNAFQSPVYIQFKVPVQTTNPNDLTIVWLNEKTGQWIPIPAVLNLKDGTITGKTTHFTKYAVVDRSKIATNNTDVTSEIQSASKQILLSSSFSEWEALALLRSGSKVPASYLVQLENQLKESKGQFRKVTDAERIAIALRAAGEDATKFAGFNLIESIYNHASMTNQGTNGPIFALLALDSGKYEVPANALWTRAKLVDWLLSQQNTSGAFPLASKGDDNIDITAMAISALAPYQAQENVKSAIDKAVKWISAEQQVSGGFKSYGEENSESVAQVIIALTSAGISPLETSFLKKNGDLLTSLLSFRQEDGGFAHVIGQTTDSMATEQALLALVAYDRFNKLQPSLYDIAADTSLTSVKQLFVDNKLISAWAYDAVYRVFDAKVMVGVSGTELRFDPKKQMTRAEFATLLVNLLGETPANNSAQVFKDVQSGAWYFGAIMRAKELGIIQGITSDTFKPNQAVTRQEMAIMIAKAFSLKGSTEPLPFKDASTIHTTAKDYVNAVYTNGFMQGSNGNFDPKSAVTREMAAVVADKLLKQPAA